MGLKLKIGNTIVNPAGDVRITYEREFLDWKRLYLRKSAGTNKFTVPRVELERALGVIGLLDTELEKRRIDASVIHEGTEIDQGFVVVDSYDNEKDVYHVRFVSGIMTFWKVIENKKLAELTSVSQYNHELTLENFIRNIENAYPDDGLFTYAFSQYGMLNKDGAVVINYQMPVFYVGILVEIIFQYAGYRYDDETLYSFFRQEAITPARGWDSVIDQTTESWTWEVAEQKPADKWSSDACQNECRFEDQPNGSRWYWRRLYWQGDDTDEHLDAGAFRITNDQNYRLRITGNLKYFRGYYPSSYWLEKIIIYRFRDDGSVDVLDVLTNGNGYTYDSQNEVYVFDYDRVFTLGRGDSIQIWYASTIPCCHDNDYTEFDERCDENGYCEWKCQVIGWGGGWNDCETYGGCGDCSGEMPLIRFGTETGAVAQVNMNVLMPDMTATDFLREVMIRKGLYLNIDDRLKTLALKKISDIFENTGKHWRAFQVRKIEYTPSGLAKENVLRYQYIQDELQDFADGSLRVGNVNLPEKQDFFVSKFAASLLGDETVAYYDNEGDALPSGTIKMQRTFFWRPQRNDQGEITKWTKKGGKPFWVVVENRREWRRKFYKLRTYYGNPVTELLYPNVVRFIDADFGHYVNEYYISWWTRLYRKYTKVTITMYMTLSEMQLIDMEALHTFEGLPDKWLFGKLKWKGDGEVEAEIYRVK